jgi:hypothetical protein
MCSLYLVPLLVCRMLESWGSGTWKLIQVLIKSAEFCLGIKREEMVHNSLLI